jgi:ribosomal-protein-alanine N-acetyltransferase
MTVADVDAVLSIEASVQAYPWTRGNFCDAIDSVYLCFVDETAGELCGYAVLMPGVEEAELLNIGVAAAFQRKGLGRRMLSTLLKTAAEQGLNRVFLEVRAGNRAAIALYLRAGFSQVGVRRGYYQNAAGSEDALVMACDAAARRGEWDDGQA